MDERTLAERLAGLEVRLARLETLLAPLSERGPASHAPSAERAEAPPILTPVPETLPPPRQPASPTADIPHAEASVAKTAAAAERPPPLPALASKADIFAEMKRTRLEPSATADADTAASRGRAAHRGDGGIAAAALEAQVGVKWVGSVGAILVVIGAALLIKYAYDRNWFGTLPKAVRLTLMSLGGFGLLAAGEAVFRRVGAVAASGLFGAGVATLFVVSFAGYEYLELYGRNVSFVLMALVTLIGATVAIRGNLVSIAALAIIGGNVAPIVLSSDSKQVVPLFAYLLMLQVVALVLAWWGREPKWWALRGLVFVTICLWVAVPLTAPRQFSQDPRGAVLAFALLYAALFHLELVLSSLRPPAAPRYATGFAVPVPLGGPNAAAEERGIGVTFSLLVTAALTVAVLAVFGDAHRLYRGAWTIGIGGACLLLSIVLPRLRGRRNGSTSSPPASPDRTFGLATGYRIQAATLLVVTVPVALAGVWVTVAWATLGAAFAFAGAALNLSVSRVAGVLVWMLSVAHLAVWTVESPVGRGALATWFVLLGEPIPAYGVLAAVMAVVGHAIAALVREDWTQTAAAHQQPALTASEHASPAGETPDADGTHNLNYESRTAVRAVPVSESQFQSLATMAEIVAVGVFLLAAYWVLPGLGLTLAMLGYGWAMVGVDRLARSPVLLPAGLLLMAAAAAKWLLIDTLGRILEIGPARAAGFRPVYNPAVAVGAALFVSAIALLRLPVRPLVRPPGARADATLPAELQQTVRPAAGFSAVLILLWTVTMEIDRYFEFAGGAAIAADPARAKQVAISIFWSLYAVACVVLGFRIRLAGLRYFGLALFGVTALKVMLIDLSQVQRGYRILSFLGLGLLLLATSVLYGKLSPVLLGGPTRDEEDARIRSTE